MKRILTALFIGAALAVPGRCEIYEIKSLQEANTHLSTGTLVIFDLDNTVMKPAQMLGTHMWYDGLVKGYLKEGLSEEDAHKRAIAFWNRVHKISSMVPVESGGPKFIRLIQKGHMVMALTARDPRFHWDTFRQLLEVNVDFRSRPAAPDGLTLDLPKPAAFHNGVLFAHGNPKGEVLKQFLDKAGLKPARIVMIDDKRYNLESVESSLSIPFVGLRYGGADADEKNFDPRIAEIQGRHFGRILSDDDARRLK